MTKNHTRQAITHEERFKLQQYKENNKAATQEQCAEWFFKTYGKKISQSTVSDSLNSRRHRATPITEVRNPARSRDGKPKWSRLETPLYERARFEIEHGNPVTKPMLARWATEMFPTIYSDVRPVPSFSIGMMARFADRNGIVTTSSKEKHTSSPPSSMGMLSTFQSPQDYQKPSIKQEPYYGNSAINPHAPGSETNFILSNPKPMGIQGGTPVVPTAQFPISKDHSYENPSHHYSGTQITSSYAYPPGFNSPNNVSRNMNLSTPNNPVTASDSIMNRPMVPVLPSCQAGAVPSASYYKTEPGQTIRTPSGQISPISPMTSEPYQQNSRRVMSNSEKQYTSGFSSNELQYSQQLPRQINQASGQSFQSTALPSNDHQEMIPAQIPDNSHNQVYIRYDQNYHYMQYPQQQQTFQSQYPYNNVMPGSTQVNQHTTPTTEQMRRSHSNSPITVSNGFLPLQSSSGSYLSRSTSNVHQNRHNK